MFLVYFTGSIIALYILGSVIKAFPKLLILVPILYLFFKLGFSMTPTEFREKLDKVSTNEATNSKIEKMYGDFTEKRDK